MYLCDDDHEEVAYADAGCPACAVKERLESEVSDLQTIKTDYEDEIEELNGTIDELEEKLKQFSGIEESIINAVKERI